MIGQDKAVKAGEMFTQPAVLKDKSTFEVTFTPTTSAKTLTQTLTVEQSANITGNTLYAAPEGKRRPKARQSRRWI